jgi:hypothetical protein
MADSDTDSEASIRFDSWVSFYASKAREKEGVLQVIKKAKVMTTAFLRFVSIVGNSAECQKIDKMPSVPE